MFGYIVINKSELEPKEYDIYHSFYCGLCRTLKNKYGYKGQVALNFDLTFIAILLTGLYEPKTQYLESRCFLHPVHKEQKSFNEYIDYAAQMTIVLSYLKCEDDWLDEKRHVKRIYGQWLKKSYLKIKKEYPKKIQSMEIALQQLQEYENAKCYQLDTLSQCFGKVMGHLCTYQNDEWSDELYQFGYYFGQFIYFMDAYDDLEADLKKKRYNPFQMVYQNADFEEDCHTILEMMISKATDIFEQLPILENADIIRNILYNGCWQKYILIKKQRTEDQVK